MRGNDCSIGALIIFAAVSIFLFCISTLATHEARWAAVSDILQQTLRSIVSISPDKVDPANEGKMVYLTGLPNTPEKLVDKDFGVSADAVLLERVVEMYQWDEICHEEEVTTGGNTATTRDYTMSQIWYPEPIDSEKFNDKTYKNPPAASFGPYSLTIKPQELHIGAFRLNHSFFKKLTKCSYLRHEEIPAGFFSLPFANTPPVTF